MRPSASLCQSSRHRLLTLPLVLLLGILCAQTVGGSRAAFPSFGFPDFVNISEGGTLLERNYHLISQCRAHVQITHARGRHAINARGNASSDFALLTFESYSPTELKIVGVKTQKYLCFSRRGRLIGRTSGHSKRCRFRVREKGGYIMLQSIAQPSWYVGFNRNGFSKRGYAIPRNVLGGSSSSGGQRQRQRQRQQGGVGRPGHGRHGRKRAHRKDVSRRGGNNNNNNNNNNNRRRLRHDSYSSRRSRTSRKRGEVLRSREQQARDKTMCFQFIQKPTEKDLSDPRVQNSLSKKRYDPWQGSDVSKFISTPSPR